MGRARDHSRAHRREDSPLEDREHDRDRQDLDAAAAAAQRDPKRRPEHHDSGGECHQRGDFAPPGSGDGGRDHAHGEAEQRSQETGEAYW
jgi:hypothetical protein